MWGVWGVSCGRIHVDSSDDSTWKSISMTATVDPPGGWGAQDIQDVLPSEGGTEVVSSGGVPGGVSDTDGDAGALRAPAHKRQRGDAGGGQPPPSHGVPLVSVPKIGRDTNKT